jgi:hypothetical protein
MGISIEQLVYVQQKPAWMMAHVLLRDTSETAVRFTQVFRPLDGREGGTANRATSITERGMADACLTIVFAAN